MPEIPRLLEPQQLLDLLPRPDILVIDLSNEETYLSGHIPGAVHLNPGLLMSGKKPAAGRLPALENLTRLLNKLGIDKDRHVVACDDEGGGWAGRLIWTLDVLGHEHWSYLNGGMTAWRNEGHPLNSDTVAPEPVQRSYSLDTTWLAEAEDILQALGNEDFVVWDARSRDEYDGIKVLAKKGGHIPGAIHCEWTSLMDPARNLRIREDAKDYLACLGITADKHIVTHCQSHHRSAFTYLVARLLGFPHVRGYHGSWSEWGNLPNTPAET